MSRVYTVQLRLNKLQARQAWRKTGQAYAARPKGYRVQVALTGYLTLRRPGRIAQLFRIGFGSDEHGPASGAQARLLDGQAHDNVVDIGNF
jgi:hypothetical protein